MSEPTQAALVACRACHYGHPNECENPTHCRKENPVSKSTVVAQYRKKPVVIEAIQFDGSGDSCTAVAAFLGTDGSTAQWKRCTNNGGWVITLEGQMEFGPGDWLIKGVKGEFYPCKPDIFEATYDLA